MNFTRISAKVAFIAIICSASSVSNAEIKKCLEHDGSINYSDRSCQDASEVGHLNVEDTTPAGIESLQAYEAQNAAQAQLLGQGSATDAVEETVPAVQTPWAQLPVTQVRYSTDVETVSQARETLASLDRQKPSSQAKAQQLSVYR